MNKKLLERLAIKKQLEFVEWLKVKKIYNPMTSAMVMVRMQEVWEACNETK
jgi:hypothetical protein